MVCIFSSVSSPPSIDNGLLVELFRERSLRFLDWNGRKVFSLLPQIVLLQMKPLKGNDRRKRKKRNWIVRSRIVNPKQMKRIPT